jgi:hypothetical protein
MTEALLTAKSPSISTQRIVELRNVGIGFNDKQVPEMFRWLLIRMNGSSLLGRAVQEKPRSCG